MKKILLALMLLSLFRTGANAQSHITINNYTDCDVWVSVKYQDITGCQYFSGVFLVSAGTSPVYYYTGVPSPWIPPGCVFPNLPNDFGYFFTATVYDADPVTCVSPGSCTVGACFPYSASSSIGPLSSCSKCGSSSLNCIMSNPCPPNIITGAQASTLTIN